MDYEKMTSEDFRNEVALRREKIYSKTYKVGSIKAQEILEEEYDKLCADAASGDPIAEDLLAEWFRNGNQVVYENIDLSMKWLILAGANGNKFSLDRLKLHFYHAFDEIVALKDFRKIQYRHKITASNYHYVLGKIFCDAIIDDLNIDPLELAKATPRKLEYSGIIMRSFNRSIARAMDKVIEYLRK